MKIFCRIGAVVFLEEIRRCSFRYGGTTHSSKSYDFRSSDAVLRIYLISSLRLNLKIGKRRVHVGNFIERHDYFQRDRE